MKIRISVWILFLLYIIFLADAALAVESKSEKSPSIFLPSVIARFAPVVEGVTVTHDFVIQNNGNAPFQSRFRRAVLEILLSGLIQKVMAEEEFLNTLQYIQMTTKGRNLN